MEKKKVIIIGAGPAGLTAAYKLLTETDYKPVILEESPYIGGISRTAVHNGNRMDLGGHRFFSKDDSVMKFWFDLMPLQGAPAKDDIILSRPVPLAEGGPDPESEERVMLVRDRVSRIYFLKKFFDYPVTLSGATLKNMGFRNTMRVGFGYMASVFHKLPEDSLENFYINRFGRPLYEMFFEDYTTKLWGVSPKNISADWGAQRVKGLSLSKALWSFISKPFKKKGAEVETSLIEQFYYPKKGPGQLWETLAAEITRLGGEICMNTRVTGLDICGGRVCGVNAVCGGAETVYTGEKYISSMPIKDLIAGVHGSEVPAQVRDVALNLPYRDYMTVGVLVNKLKIKNETAKKTVGNIVPDCWIYIQERDVRMGRLQIFNNWSPYMVNDLENTVWIGTEYFCDEGDEMWNMSDSDFTALAVEELVRIGIIESGSDVLDTERLRVKKAYPAYFGVYKDFDKVREYLDSVENLYCVGRNGQHRYNNMDHSMLTAFEAVAAIKSGSASRDGIWNVNTEKSYHETKSK